MPEFLKMAAQLLAGRMAGSNNKASFVVHGLRFAYISTGGVIAIAWYSGWRNERIPPGSFRFPVPGVGKLIRQYPINREDGKLAEAPEGPKHKEFGTSIDQGINKNFTSGGNGTAENAPRQVQKVIEWASSVSGKYPYKWGGGHPRVGTPSVGEPGGSPGTAGPPPGYDCSGAVTGALHAGGLIASSATSGELMTYGQKGPGKWITIYANGTHTFMKIKVNNVWRWFGTGSDKLALRGGPAWGNYDPDLSAYAERHPVGF